MVKKLLRDNILIKVLPEEELALASGIILPGSRKDSRVRGRVARVIKTAL
jgi:co-chaperonin GroES (HSP10)